MTDRYGKNSYIRNCLMAVLLFATLAFIWGNSLESPAESGEKSRLVMLVITPVLELVTGEGGVTQHLVRKLAHFTEYGILGCELAAFLILRRRVQAQAVVNCLFAVLTAAVADEAIQLLSGRGSQVSDVLLDFCGAAAGVLSVLLLRAAVLHLKKRRPSRV